MTLVCSLDTFFPSQRFFPQATLILHLWGQVTWAKNLLTFVSSRSFQLEPPKGLLHFAPAKEVLKSQDICFWETISKYVFFSENFWETSHTSIGSSSVVKYPTISNWWFLLGNLLRIIFHWQFQKEAVMELLPNYHQSSEWSQSVAHPCFHQ